MQKISRRLHLTSWNLQVFHKLLILFDLFENSCQYIFSHSTPFSIDWPDKSFNRFSSHIVVANWGRLDVFGPICDWTTVVWQSHLNLQFLLLLVDLCDSLLEHWGRWQDPQWAHLQLFNAGLTKKNNIKADKVSRCNLQSSHQSGNAMWIIGLNAWKKMHLSSYMQELKKLVSRATTASFDMNEPGKWLNHHHQQPHLPSRSPCCYSLYPTPPPRRRDSDLQPLWWSTAAVAPAATGSWGSPCYVGAFSESQDRGGTSREVQSGEGVWLTVVNIVVI